MSLSWRPFKLRLLCLTALQVRLGVLFLFSFGRRAAQLPDSVKSMHGVRGAFWHSVFGYEKEKRDGKFAYGRNLR